MEKTLENIDKLYSKINGHPDYSSAVRKKFFSYLNEEALKHSVDMEINGEIPSLSRKGLARLKKKSFINLKNAGDFLWDNGLSLYSLSSLGKRIEPEKNVTSLRTKDVTFGDCFSPPSSGKLYDCLGNLLSNIKYFEKKVHPISLASMAHIGIVQIHPFLDGNGRAARLVQNYILEKNGFPSALIFQEESELYRGLMGCVMHDRYSSKSDFFAPSAAENNFNLYIAGRVFQSLRELDKELSNKKNYTIVFKNLRDKEVLYTIKKIISTSTQKNTCEGIRISKGNASLKYCGPLDSSFFIKDLEKLSRKYNFKYEVLDG